MTFLIEGFDQGLTSEDLLTLCIQQIERRENDITNAIQILWNSRLVSKRQFEKQFETRLVQGSYSPGDIVLVRNTAIEKELNRKMKLRYLGPYKVVQQTLGNSYVLEELDGVKLTRPIAAFRVIPYITHESLELLTKGRAAEEIDTETETEPEGEASKNGDDLEWNLTKLPEPPTHADE
jgi:hypothetical protein